MRTIEDSGEAEGIRSSRASSRSASRRASPVIPDASTWARSSAASTASWSASPNAAIARCCSRRKYSRWERPIDSSARDWMRRHFEDLQLVGHQREQQPQLVPPAVELQNLLPLLQREPHVVGQAIR